MSQISRRALARYGVNQLLAGAKPSVVAQQLTAVLFGSNRVNDYQFLLDDIAWELENRQLVASGKVTSARPISQKLLSQLEAQIKKATRVESVQLQTEIDQTLLGGFKVETAGRLWDQTIRTKLTQLRENI